MTNVTKLFQKLVVSVLVIVGGVISIQASWLPTKAWVSQQLINYSWQQSMTAQKPLVAIKPWPWADTYPVAELIFQRLDKSIVVLNGGDPTTLAFSAGAVAPFNQPTATNPFVVAGHRDSHFAFLEDIAMKDVISLVDAQGKAQLYQVQNIDIVDATTGQLPLIADEKTLVLITCYPFNQLGNDSNERYVITAKPF